VLAILTNVLSRGVFPKKWAVPSTRLLNQQRGDYREYFELTKNQVEPILAEAMQLLLLSGHTWTKACKGFRPLMSHNIKDRTIRPRHQRLKEGLSIPDSPHLRLAPWPCPVWPQAIRRIPSFPGLAGGFH